VHVPVEPLEYYRTLARLLERLGAVPSAATA
jgi:hypothetical protein